MVLMDYKGPSYHMPRAHKETHHGKEAWFDYNDGFSDVFYRRFSLLF
jgi:hypothetical protein